MSWLLGQRYKQQESFSEFVNQPPVSGGSDDGNKNSDNINQKKSMEYRFDSSALERAAAAAKELEKSGNAKEILHLSMQQEASKQKEFETEMKKHEAYIEQLKSERNKVDAEERRRMLQEETKQHQARAQYQDQLARKRYDDQVAQQHRMNEENLRRQEESVAKQEAMKKATIEHQIAMENKNYEKRLEMEMRAKAKLKRENFDLTLDKLRLQAKEKRETTLESIKLYGMGARAFLEDPKKITAAVGGLTMLAVGVYAARSGTGIIARQLEARLMKPTLVKETSRISPLEVVSHPIKSTKKFLEKRKLSQSKDALKDIILCPEIEEKMRHVAIGTKMTKRNQANFRHLLMYGPPGTGKTMFARMLAYHSGLDYAFVRGGDFNSLGKDGVIELQKLFYWTETSRKGVLLFVDEAEAFLRHRNFSENRSEGISVAQRDMLSVFLEQTGTASRNCMLALATNVPEVLDSAILDRIDIKVKFELPGLEERERLVRHYFAKYVLEFITKNSKKYKMGDFDFVAFCSKAAELTDGFSGRQIEKLAIAWQTDIFTSVDGIFTEEKACKTLEDAIKEHRQLLEVTPCLSKDLNHTYDNDVIKAAAALYANAQTKIQELESEQQEQKNVQTV